MAREEGKWSIDWGLYGPKAGGELSELTKGEGAGTQAEVAQTFADALAGWLVQNYGARISGWPPARHWWWRVVRHRRHDHGAEDVAGDGQRHQGGDWQTGGDKVTFNLSLQGDKAELIRGLQLESRLRQLADTPRG